MFSLMQILDRRMTEAAIHIPGGLERADIAQTVQDLAAWGEPTARYIWVIRAHSSTLTRLNVHPLHAEDGLVDLRSAQADRRTPTIFGLAGSVCTALSYGRAMDRMQHQDFEYEVYNSAIFRKRSHASISLGHLRTAADEREPQRGHHVQITRYSRQIDREDLSAIRILGHCQARIDSGHRTSAALSMQINGEDMNIVRARAVEHAATPLAQPRMPEPPPHAVVRQALHRMAA